MSGFQQFDRQYRFSAGKGANAFEIGHTTKDQPTAMHISFSVEKAAAMGVTLTFSYNPKFTDFPNGFSCVGYGRVALDKACASTGLQWQIQNGILQVKNKGDTMSREVYVLSSDSGLIGIPKKIHYNKSSKEKDNKPKPGWEVEYFLNGAIGIGDYIRLESKAVKNYFRIHSVNLDGDNLEGDWMCSAKLLEA